MTQEELDLLVKLLQKANNEKLLHIEDDEESTYEVTYVRFDVELCISLKEI